MRWVIRLFLLVSICSQAQTISTFATQQSAGPLQGGSSEQTTLSDRAASNIRFAGSFSGRDCGARINAAYSALGRSGAVWVNERCGTSWITPVIIPAHSVLRFIGGTYLLSAGITMNDGSVITGEPLAMVVDTTSSNMLRMADGANLPSILTVNGSFAAIQDIVIDGNESKNPRAGPNIIIKKGARPDIERVVTGNSNSHGIELDSVSDSPKIFKLMSYQNKGDGLFCNGSGTGGGDGFVLDSEFEANQGNGIELSNCPAWRIQHSDISTNAKGMRGACGIKIYGTMTGGQAIIEQIVHNQFGDQFRDDICIEGYNSGNTSLGDSIVGNVFLGSSKLLAANTYNNIMLTDGGPYVITANTFNPSTSPTTACGISINETRSGHFVPSQIWLNTWNGNLNAWSTQAVCDHTANKSNGLLMPIQGASSGSVLLTSLSPPLIASGFGSSPSISKSNGTAAFTITIGTSGSSSSGVLTMPTANNGWQCDAIDITSPNKAGGYYVKQTAGSTTSVTLTGYNNSGSAAPWFPGDVIGVKCSGY
jgi:hypothetical protein